jgi:hypothetical protein
MKEEIIFINYRRADDQSAAGRLYDQLEGVFTRARIFIDVDSIPPGRDFAQEVAERVIQCDIFLALIGRHWVDATDDDGVRRLDNPNDWVRIEIEAALRLDKHIIPVLVDGAEMPHPDKLPESLRLLTRRNAIRLTHERFRADVLGLIDAIGKLRNEALAEADAKYRPQGDPPRAEARRTESMRKTHESATAPSPIVLARKAGALRYLAFGALVVVAGVCGLVFYWPFLVPSTQKAVPAAQPSTSVSTMLTRGQRLVPLPQRPLAAHDGHSASSAAPVDEAQRAGRIEASFPQANEDFFREMDSGVQLAPEDVQGRNMWLVWTGGNDRFWDRIAKDSLATLDLLKIVTSHPSQNYCESKRCDRDSRWHWLGVINEPCFQKPTAPDPQRFGLWFDVRSTNCGPDPFENEAKYPGVKIGARGRTFDDGSKLPVGSYYGFDTGVLGLRLFPNPDFDQAAKNKWDPERYYSDPSYYNDPDLVRPYRVGMACGFCHVGPSPVHPPADPAHPQWADLSSTVGNQYLRMDRVLVYMADPKNFIYQLVHSYLPGTYGHVAGLDRLHQQSTHDECNIPSRTAACRSKDLGERNAKGCRALRQAARWILRSAGHDMVPSLA